MCSQSFNSVTLAGCYYLLESLVLEKRGITGDNLIQPPGFSLNGSKKKGPRSFSGLPKADQPEHGRTRTGLTSENSRCNYLSTAPYSCHGINVVLWISKFNQVKCVFWKVKNEEIEFEEHSTFMRCAHFRSLEMFLWCKGFLNKGFHWPVGSRHAHTNIILLLAIP